MVYSISEISNLAGISVRTLHFYDNEGLLVPQRNPQNGYREYSHHHLITLQQILIYREMDFSIAQIKTLLTKQNDDLLHCLTKQKHQLKQKVKHINFLIEKIEVSMNTLDKQRINDTLYEGIDKTKAEQWEHKARNQYTNSKIDQSYQRLSKLNSHQLQSIKEEGEQIAVELARHLTSPIDSDVIQNIVARHHHWIENFYSAPYETYAGLADMYLASDEFTHYYDKHKKGTTEHLAQAMHVYAKNNL